MQIHRRIFRRYSAPERRKKWRHKEGKAEETGVEGRKAERASGRSGRKKGTQEREKKRTQEREKKGTQEQEKKGTQEQEKRERKSGRKRKRKSRRKRRKNKVPAIDSPGPACCPSGFQVTEYRTCPVHTERDLVRTGVKFSFGTAYRAAQEPIPTSSRRRYPALYK